MIHPLLPRAKGLDHRCPLKYFVIDTGTLEEEGESEAIQISTHNQDLWLGSRLMI